MRRFFCAVFCPSGIVWMDGAVTTITTITTITTVVNVVNVVNVVTVANVVNVATGAYPSGVYHYVLVMETVMD